MKKTGLVILLLMSLPVSAPALAADSTGNNMIVVTKVDKNAVVTDTVAKYAQFNVVFGIASDVDGNFFAAPGIGFKPISVSFKLAGKKVSMSFLDTYVLLRVSTKGMASGKHAWTNFARHIAVDSSISITEKFNVGLQALRIMMRDSTLSMVYDWAQLSAAFTMVSEKGHKLSASITPFFRTNMPYESSTASVSHQLWIPIQLVYNYTYQKLSLKASAGYVPVQSLTSTDLLHLMVYGVDLDYRITPETSKLDMRVFVDVKMWLKWIADKKEFEFIKAMDLTQFMAGLRLVF
ncbi:MAG: hypothetical protein A2583_04035 [Bdellovibrionales bacterium RIFOXYD1_FULL_53_11]|nr:MAG: hypothetical protein A2583_04035 [Bdellovibrionales bacterium RIFOXYD1_FULL_53_11]